MKKVLVAVLAIIAVAAVVLGLYGSKHGWFSKKPEPQPVAVKPVSPPVSYLVREQEKPIPADPVLTKQLIDTTQAENVSGPLAILMDPAKDPTSRNEAANLLHRSPYTSSPGSAGGYATGTTQTSSDEPSDSLNNTFTRKWVNGETFTMYLMFLPPGGDSRYVPLRSVSWGWSIAATRGAGGWSVDANSNTQNAGASAETTTHPTWTDNVDNHKNWIND